MLKNLLILSFCFCFTGLFSQSVVASGGQSGSSNDLHASATIGEAIIGTGNNGTEAANQGFQQPLQRDITSVIETASKVKINLTVGPIPTTGLIRINLDKPLNGTLLLTDITGRQVLKSTIQKQRLNYSMDLSRFNPSTYFLTVLSEDGTKHTSIPIPKI